jgi:hypothetical protein
VDKLILTIRTAIAFDAGDLLHPGYYWAYPLRTIFVPEKRTGKRQKTVLELENSRTV